MKKIHRLLKVMGTAIFVALTGLALFTALFTRIPKSEGAGSMPIPSSSLSSNISMSTPTDGVPPSQVPSPQEMELDNSHVEQGKREADAAFSLLIHDREIVIWENVGEAVSYTHLVDKKYDMKAHPNYRLCADSGAAPYIHRKPFLEGAPLFLLPEETDKIHEKGELHEAVKQTQ